MLDFIFCLERIRPIGLLGILWISFNYTANAQITDLIISEYVEGSGNEKYIEIYNGTGQSVDLSDYELQLFSNGSAVATTISSLSGILPNNNTKVYKNALATLYVGSAEIKGAVNFNGDDAITLYKISTASHVDIFGNIGCDPGSSWTGGGNTTADQSLRRIPSLCAGVNSDPATSCPFPTLSSEWTSAALNDVSDLGAFASTCCTVGSAPTIATSSSVVSNLDCNSVTISFVTGNGNNRLIIMSTSPITATPDNKTNYPANTSFGNGAEITTGNYSLYSGSAASVNITNLAQNQLYYYAIYEFNKTTTGCDEAYLTSSFESGSLTTTLGCNDPYIKSILVNSCGVSSDEGLDEKVVFYTGNAPVSIDDITVIFPAEGTYCNGGPCGTKTLINNPSHVSSLNGTAGCTETLIYYADPIPAHSAVVLFTGNPPSYTFDFSGICGSGPIYAIFCNNTSGAGRFANAANATRTLQIRWGAYSQSVSYYSSAGNTGNDGDYVYYDVNGNPSYLNEGNCVVQPLASLASELEIHSLKDINILRANIYTNQTLELIHLEKSTDGYNYFEIDEFSGDQRNIYIEDQAAPGTNYYRIKAKVKEGGVEYSKTVSVKYLQGELIIQSDKNQWQISTQKSSIRSFTLYNLSGQAISLNHSLASNSLEIPNTQLPAGIYILKVKIGNKYEVVKLFK